MTTKKRQRKMFSKSHKKLSPTPCLSTMFLFCMGITGILLCACGKNTQRHFTSISDTNHLNMELLHKRVTDTFEMKDIQKFDLLFVIDNSENMDDYQEPLSKSMESFIKQFQNTTSQYEYQIGVIPIDHYRHHQGLHSGPSNTPILTQDTPNLEELFMENTKVGVNGDTRESGMRSLVNFLEKDGNTFWREDSYLKVIIVSNEPDRKGRRFNSTKEYVSHYVNRLTQIKGDDRFSISTIVTTSREPHPVHNKIFYGEKYIAMAHATSGSVHDIKSLDFHFIMEQIGQSLKRNMNSVLSLSYTPAKNSKIEVYLNGEEKIKDQDWSFSEGNRILLHSSFSYGPGDVIEVLYTHSE